MGFLAIMLSAWLAASPTCEVQGMLHSVHSVSVVGPKGRTFTTDLWDVPVRARFAGGRVMLEGEGPLAFTATVERERVRVRLKEAGTIDGFMTVGTSMTLEVRQVRADAVQVMARDSSDTTAIGPFAVRCDQLTLDRPPTDNLRTYEEVPHVFALSASGTLRTEPNGGARLGFDLGEMWFDQLEVRDGWTKVGATWDDGSVLTGWLPAVSDRAPKVRASASSEWVIGCGGGVGPIGAYRGPATLKVGGRVYSDPDRGDPWAHARAEVPVEVVGDRGMVRVTMLPGFAPCDLKAYARAEDLTFPK